MKNYSINREIRSQEHFDAIRKNNNLIGELSALRKTALGIGTRKLKIRLNKLTNPLAKAYRIALEIEDKSVQAKSCYGKYRKRLYDVKQKLILDLASVFEEQEWVYGKQEQEGLETHSIIYFDMPNCGQISFHCNLPFHIPEYVNEWIGKQDKTTYSTLLQGIHQSFGKELLFNPVEESIVSPDIHVKNVRAN